MIVSTIRGLVSFTNSRGMSWEHVHAVDTDHDASTEHRIARADVGILRTPNHAGVWWPRSGAVPLEHPPVWKVVTKGNSFAIFGQVHDQVRDVTGRDEVAAFAVPCSTAYEH